MCICHRWAENTSVETCLQNNFVLKVLSFLLYTERNTNDDKSLKISVISTDQEVSVILLLGQTRVNRENIPVWLSNHKTFHILILGIEPERQWWEARAFFNVLIYYNLLESE